jgi:2-polyprenyl-3-methyl-5-hydroxy-6-metoxy-1,4-benzoquinol methylase
VLGISDTERELADARRRAQLLGIDHVAFEVHDLRELDSLPAPPEPYDNVICLEVIEHVIDDVAVLRALARRTRTGGRLLLSTPTAEHRPQYLEMRHQTAVEDGRHVRYGYSPAQLRRVVEAAGFSVAQLEGVGGILMQTVTDVQRRLNQTSGALGWALTLPLRALRVIDPFVTRRTGAAHLSYGVVATKVRDT